MYFLPPPTAPLCSAYNGDAHVADMQQRTLGTAPSSVLALSLSIVAVHALQCTRCSARVRASTLWRPMARGGWQGRLAPTGPPGVGRSRAQAGDPLGATPIAWQDVFSKLFFSSSERLENSESGHCWIGARTDP
jgi:hypothetical protein